MEKRKRGRPAKPKIETVKNPVGKPLGHKCPKALASKKIIYAKLIVLSYEHPELTGMEKRDLLVDICRAGDGKVSSAIALYNKQLKAGKIAYVFKENGLNVVAMLTKWEIKSAELNFKMGRKPFELNKNNCYRFYMPEMNYQIISSTNEYKNTQLK